MDTPSDVPGSLRREARLALSEHFRSPGDFDAFCIDHFPEVYKTFSSTMDRIGCINALLTKADPQLILDKLLGPTARFAHFYAKNPYRGLAVFEIEHAEQFYGRQELIAELRKRVAELLRTKPSCRLLSLLGHTGCGKSSLLRAGLLASLLRPSLDILPQLGREQIALFVPGDRPLHSMATALARCAGSSLPFDEIYKLLEQPNGLIKVYERLVPVPGERDRLFIVAVDQLEELFVLRKLQDKEARLMSARLAEAAVSNVTIVVLVTLHSDYLEPLNKDHPELNQTMGQNTRLVSDLNRNQLREAIAAPAEKVGRPLNDKLIEALLGQASEQKHSLPLVQFTLQRLWAGISAGQDGLSMLERLGGIGGALASWADSLYAALDDDLDRRRAQRLFLGLVQLVEKPPAGAPSTDSEPPKKPPAENKHLVTRRLRRVDDLIPVGQDKAVTHRLLYHFSRAHHDQQHGRLISVSEGEVMLAHETLVTSWGKLATWLREAEEQVIFLARLDAAISHWKKQEHAQGVLWRDPDLKKLRELRLAAEPILNLQQEQFLLASEEVERRELAERAALSEQHRRMAALLAVAVVGLLGCLIALFFWFKLEREAKNLARSSSAAALVTQPGREVLALLRAMQAAGESEEIGPLWEGLYQVSMYLVRSRTLDSSSARAQPAAAKAEILSVAFATEKEHLLAGSTDGRLALWDLQSARELRTLPPHKGAVNFAGYARQGKLILTASEDETAKVWDARTEVPIAALRGHKGGVMTADLSPDGAYVLTAGRDGTARIFRIRDAKELKRLPHTDVVYSARYSPSGNRIVTASKDQLVRIFDTETGVLLRAIGPSSASSTMKESEALATQTDGHRSEVRYASFSRDEKRLFTAGEDNAVIAWEAETGRQLLSFSGHTGPVNTIEESPSGHEILTASEDSTARIWDVRTGKLMMSLAGQAHQLSSAVYSSDGKTVATASRGEPVRLFSLFPRPHLRIEAHSDWVRSAVFSPEPVEDQAHILTASADGTACVWDRHSGQRLLELKGHNQWVNSAVYSPDGKRILTAGMDRTARVWDAASGTLLATLRGHTDWIRYAAFSSDGNLIVTASKDRKAKIWSATDWKLVRTLHGHEGAVTSAVFSSDGREVLTASEDHTARRFSVQTGDEIGRLKQHEDLVRHAVYSKSGTRILTASYDRTALIWDAVASAANPQAKGLQVAERPLLTLTGHTGWVRHAVYSEDEQHILTAAGDMTARLWDAKTGTQLLILTGHSGPVSMAEFSHDARYAVTAGRDGLVIVHTIDSKLLWRHGCEILRSVRNHPDISKQEVRPILDEGRCRPDGNTVP